MKTQISRDSHQNGKRYSGVYQQQGRMLTDSDINEQSDISKFRLESSLLDTIGSGIPAKGGLAINSDGTIKPGKAYVDGVPALVTGVDPLGYDAQADYPEAPAITETDYLLYLDVWERSVAYLEDTRLLDPGLHGADTCTRSQTMAQIRWCPASRQARLESLPNKGNAPLTLSLRSGSESANDCDPCADLVDLDSSVGNYLFRLEVHHVRYSASGEADRITLKWSSENGAEAYKIGEEPVDFSSGHWVYELFDSTTEKHLGAYISPTHSHIKRGELVESYSAGSTVFDFVRRWDGYIELKRVGANWQPIKTGTNIHGFEKGVRLKDDGDANALAHVSVNDDLTINLSSLIVTLGLKDGTSHDFLAGDFWWFPLRERQEYVDDKVLSNALPNGVDHHYLILASVSEGVATPFPGEACRALGFPRLTDLKADDVCYESGCENLYGEAKTVKQALDNLCTHLDASDIPFNNSCQKLYAEAANVQQALDELCSIQAEDIAFSGQCSALSSVTNVAEALEILCNLDSGGGCAYVVGQGGQYATLGDAFHDLRKTPAVVLCLLPGEHHLSADPGRTFSTFKLVGSGTASTSVIIEEEMGSLTIEAQEVIFRDVSFSLKAPAGQILLTADRVDVEGCVFERLNGRRQAESIVSISSEEECEVNWTGNHMTSIWMELTNIGGLTDVLLPEGTSFSGKADIGKDLTELGTLNPATDVERYDVLLGETAKKIAGLSAASRKKWTQSQPNRLIERLPDDPVRFVRFKKAKSVGAKSITRRGRYSLETSKVGVKAAAENFYKELGKRNLTEAGVAELLDGYIGISIVTGFGRCLGLADATVMGSISDNLFEGELVLNESADQGVDLGSDPFVKSHPELETPIDYDVSGSMRIAGNTLHKLVTLIPGTLIGGSANSPWLAGAMDTWRFITVAENVFSDINNSVAAYSLTVQGNHFDASNDELRQKAMFAMHYYSTYTSNLGPGNGDFRLRIQTFGGEKVHSANLLQIV